MKQELSNWKVVTLLSMNGNSSSGKRQKFRNGVVVNFKGRDNIGTPRSLSTFHATTLQITMKVFQTCLDYCLSTTCMINPPRNSIDVGQKEVVSSSCQLSGGIYY